MSGCAGTSQVCGSLFALLNVRCTLCACALCVELVSMAKLPNLLLISEIRPLGHRNKFNAQRTGVNPKNETRKT